MDGSQGQAGRPASVTRMGQGQAGGQLMDGSGTDRGASISNMDGSQGQAGRPASVTWMGQGQAGGQLMDGSGTDRGASISNKDGSGTGRGPAHGWVRDRQGASISNKDGSGTGRGASSKNQSFSNILN